MSLTSCTVHEHVIQVTSLQPTAPPRPSCGWPMFSPPREPATGRPPPRSGPWQAVRGTGLILPPLKRLCGLGASWSTSSVKVRQKGRACRATAAMSLSGGRATWHRHPWLGVSSSGSKEEEFKAHGLKNGRLRQVRQRVDFPNGTCSPSVFQRQFLFRGTQRVRALGEKALGPGMARGLERHTRGALEAWVRAVRAGPPLPASLRSQGVLR